MEYHITQYDLVQGALEIQYIEEFFGEFPRKKAATEIVRRLSGRQHLILLATASLPDDLGTVVPVSYKVAHEITPVEKEAKLGDLVLREADGEGADRFSSGSRAQCLGKHADGAGGSRGGKQVAPCGC